MGIIVDVYGWQPSVYSKRDRDNKRCAKHEGTPRSGVDFLQLKIKTTVG